MTKYIAIFTCVLGCFFSVSTAQAYNTTAQNAVAITDRAALYTIEFRLGRKDESTRVPVFAIRNLVQGADVGSLGYEFLDDSETVTNAGVSAAIVLADAQIIDGMYVLPPGVGTRFTLVAILSLSDADPRVNAAMHVTELPFYTGEEETHYGLNVHELKAYTTPEVDLNTQSAVVAGSVMTLTTTQ